MSRMHVCWVHREPEAVLWFTLVRPLATKVRVQEMRGVGEPMRQRFFSRLASHNSAFKSSTKEVC